MKTTFLFVAFLLLYVPNSAFALSCGSGPQVTYVYCENQVCDSAFSATKRPNASNGCSLTSVFEDEPQTNTIVRGVRAIDSTLFDDGIYTVSTPFNHVGLINGRCSSETTVDAVERNLNYCESMFALVATGTTLYADSNKNDFIALKEEVREEIAKNQRRRSIELSILAAIGLLPALMLFVFIKKARHKKDLARLTVLSLFLLIFSLAASISSSLSWNSDLGVLYVAAFLGLTYTTLYAKVTESRK